MSGSELHNTLPAAQEHEGERGEEEEKGCVFWFELRFCASLSLSSCHHLPSLVFL